MYKTIVQDDKNLNLVLEKYDLPSLMTHLFLHTKNKNDLFKNKSLT